MQVVDAKRLNTAPDRLAVAEVAGLQAGQPGDDPGARLAIRQPMQPVTKRHLARTISVAIRRRTGAEFGNVDPGGPDRHRMAAAPSAQVNQSAKLPNPRAALCQCLCAAGTGTSCLWQTASPGSLCINELLSPDTPTVPPLRQWHHFSLTAGFPPSLLSVSAEGLDLLKGVEELHLQPYDDQTGKDISAWVNDRKAVTGHVNLEAAWKVWNKSQGKVMKGLTKRRACWRWRPAGRLTTPTCPIWWRPSKRGPCRWRHNWLIAPAGLARPRLPVPMPSSWRRS